MTHATIIGIDLAKNVFHAHGATHDGTPIFRKKLSCNQVLPFLSEQPHCLVAMEACATAHDWGAIVKSGVLFELSCLRFYSILL